LSTRRISTIWLQGGPVLHPRPASAAKHQFLLGAAGIDRVRQVGQACGQLGALAVAMAGISVRTSAAMRSMPSTLADGRRQLAALRAHGRQRSRPAPGPAAPAPRPAGRRIGGCAAGHARQLQQVGEADLQVEIRSQAVGQAAQLAQQGLVHLQVGRRFRRAQAHHQIQLAAAQRAAMRSRSCGSSARSSSAGGCRPPGNGG
jgi:hypothetical protein